MRVIAAFCPMAMSVSYVWASFFDGRTRIFTSVCLASMMTVAQFAFNPTSSELTHWENHKYQPGNYSSPLWKQVFFNFVNHYYALFYLALTRDEGAIGTKVAASEFKVEGDDRYDLGHIVPRGKEHT